MFSPNVQALSEMRNVIAVELQRHGRTYDIDRPPSFEVMAEGVIKLMNHLGIERADVLGYSLGAGVALQIAIRLPNPCAS
jgi:pimeloyl-ACP methyl ester carboxylesterase